VLGKPARRLAFRDDGEDFDGFDRDVIENSHLPDPKPILGLAQTPQTLDPALARPSWLVPQVPFESVHSNKIHIDLFVRIMERIGGAQLAVAACHGLRPVRFNFRAMAWFKRDIRKFGF
jgi:hypothetical protein